MRAERARAAIGRFAASHPEGHMLEPLTRTHSPEALVEASRPREAQSPATAHVVGPWPMTLARCLTLVGLLASGVTGLTHLTGHASMKMCARLTPTGCQAVIVSRYGSILGVPLSLVGLAAFALVLGLSLYPRSRWAVLLTPLAVAAATAGSVLLAIQFYVLDTHCVVCMVADVAAVGLGGLLFLARLWQGRPADDLPRATRWRWVGAAIVTVLATPTAWAIVGMFSVCE